MAKRKEIHLTAFWAQVVWLLALAGACGSGSQVPLVVAVVELPQASQTQVAERSALFFVPGESMSFDISLHGITGGTAVLAVGKVGVLQGRSVVIVQSLVKSAGVMAAIKEVRDRIISWIDVEQGAVVRLRAESKYGEREASIETDLGAGIAGDFTIDYEPRGGVTQHATQKLPAGAVAYDSHAMLGLFRAWRPQGTESKSLFFLSGRRLWRTSVRGGARETISTAMGRRSAIRIDGVAQRVNRSLADVKAKKPRHYSVWISDDESRLPLLVLATTEYGDLRVELVEYGRPERRVSVLGP